MQKNFYSDRQVADTYERLALPLQFATPARDLVADLDLHSGNRVLDVGTGTGAAAVPAAAAVGPRGAVVGLDGSLAMLRHLQTKRVASAVAGIVPRLPFRDGQFDAVVASFMLSHLSDYRDGLSDMIRVLKRHGRLGATGWGTTPSSVSSVWSEVIGRFVDLDELKHAFEAVTPGEGAFSADASFHAALAEAGLTDLRVARREYVMTMTTEDYLSLKCSAVEGRLIRQRLAAAGWDVLREELTTTFRERFGSALSYVRDVFFGVGTKP